MKSLREVLRRFFGPDVDDAIDIHPKMLFSRLPNGRFEALYKGHVGEGDTRIEAARAALRSWRGGES